MTERNIVEYLKNGLLEWGGVLYKLFGKRNELQDSQFDWVKHKGSNNALETLLLRLVFCLIVAGPYSLTDLKKFYI